MVLAVRRRDEHLPIKRQVYKLAEHQVDLQTRAELLVRPHGEQRLQHLPRKQRLRRNRRGPAPRVDLIKLIVHRPQRLVANQMDRSDRVIRCDKCLDVN
jgi:hypothetical protein